MGWNEIHNTVVQSTVALFLSYFAYALIRRLKITLFCLFQVTSFYLPKPQGVLVLDVKQLTNRYL